MTQPIAIPQESHSKALLSLGRFQCGRFWNDNPVVIICDKRSEVLYLANVERFQETTRFALYFFLKK